MSVAWGGGVGAGERASRYRCLPQRLSSSWTTLSGDVAFVTGSVTRILGMIRSVIKRVWEAKWVIQPRCLEVGDRLLPPGADR
jgi:hypothetical protein